MVLYMVTVSWVYIYFKAYQEVHIKYVQIFVCQSYPNQDQTKQKRTGTQRNTQKHTKAVGSFFQKQNKQHILNLVLTQILLIDILFIFSSFFSPTTYRNDGGLPITCFA